MRRVIDADQLWKQVGAYQFAEPGVFARRCMYGDTPSLIPFGEAYPDKLVDPKDYKEVIQWCHTEKIFPMYHQSASWAPPGFKWNQNGLNYCWVWSLAGAMMTCRAYENKPPVVLSPVAAGWTVNWRNVGNYLEDGVKAVREKGLPEMKYTPNPHSLRHANYVEGWEDNAMLHRLGDTWDSPGDNIQTRIQYMVSMLKAGACEYVAHNWWGHATSVVGLIWDESVANNIRVVERNSHNEDDYIELTGNRAIPDEIIGICSTLTQVA